MHDNAALIAHFYEAFAARDGAAMALCYTPDATFSDPVFTDLRGAEIGHMWSMLCEQGTDLRIRASDIEADDTRGSARWEADYTIAATGRMVTNRIHAAFTFRDGRIATHVDTFDLYAWTRMALGLPGTLLGWSPLIRLPLRRFADRQLRRYIARHG